MVKTELGEAGQPGISCGESYPGMGEQCLLIGCYRTPRRRLLEVCSVHVQRLMREAYISREEYIRCEWKGVVVG